MLAIDTFLKSQEEDQGMNEEVHDVWVGDFNRHSPMWDAPSNSQLFTAEANRKADKLISMAVNWNMVMALPTFDAEIWYPGINILPGKPNKRGSVGVTNKIASIQRRASKFITGALSTTAGDILDIHAHILPVDLLFQKSSSGQPPGSAAYLRSILQKHNSPMHHLFLDEGSHVLGHFSLAPPIPRHGIELVQSRFPHPAAA